MDPPVQQSFGFSEATAPRPAIRYSYSRLSTLRECPRRYEFRYVRGIKEAFKGIEAFLGTVVHSTLEWLYMEREHRRTPTERAVLDRFNAEWDQTKTEHIRTIRRDDSESRRRQEGREMLSKHYHDTFAADRMTTLAVEAKVEIPFGPRRVYTGIVDRVARDAEGRLHIVDYKTAKRPPEKHGDEQTLQLRGYGAAWMRLGTADSVTLTYRYVRDGRGYSCELTPSGAEVTKNTLAARIDAADAVTDYPARPSGLCAWCGYRDICDVSGFMKGATASRDCPRCKSELQRRNGRNGEFMGCVRYPDCRYTRDV